MVTGERTLKLGPLRQPVFRQWFFSQVLSASGNMTQAVALSWLVLKLTGSGVDLGLLTSCQFLPIFLMGPFAGSLVDRVGPRRVLIVTQVLLVILSGSLAILAATGAVRIWMLFLIAAATGCVGAPDNTARQVYVIDIVGTELVSGAVALNEVVINTSRVLGPATGGALLATLGISACCVLNAASFLPPLIVVLIHRTRHHEAVAGTGLASRAAGLRYAWRDPALRACLILAAASGMLFALNIPVPLLATRVFHLGSAGFGLMMAVFGIGALPGALLAAVIARKPTGREVGVLATATGLSVVGTASAPDSALAFAGMAVTGCLSIWFISRANTLVQLAAPPQMRGRVNAAWNMALPGCMPATGPLVGWIGGAVGPRESFGAAGVALILIAAAGWRGLRGYPGRGPCGRRGSPRHCGGHGPCG